jgi:ABC-type transport system substrate-binding protein
MKRLIYLTLALTLLLGIFAVPTSAQEGNTVRIGTHFLSSVNSLDNQYWGYFQFIEGTLLEGLFGYAEDGLTIVPKVVEDWDISDDGTVWTFTLRKDKKWSNGESVTAEDFYKTWEDFIYDTQTPMWASFMQFTDGYSGRASNDFSKVGVELVDEYTLRVDTGEAPKPALYAWMTVTVSLPNYPPAFEANPGDWWKPENWVGNGPYTLVEFVPGELIAMEKNPEYVGEVGNVDRLEFRNVDMAGLIPGFEAGELYMIALGGASDVSYVQNNETLMSQLQVYDTLKWEGYQNNKTHGTTLDVLPLRQALYMAIDREYIANDIMQGMWTPAHTYGWAAEPRIADAVEGLPYDPEAALDSLQVALDELGLTDASELPQFVFYTPPANSGNMPVYEEIVRQWNETLGLNVVVQPEDWGIIGTYTWSGTNPNLEEGWTPVGGAINVLDPEYLQNQAFQTVNNVGWTGEVRALETQRNEANNALATIDTPPTDEEFADKMAEARELAEPEWADLFEAQGWTWLADAYRRGNPIEEQFVQWEEEFAAAMEEGDEETAIGIWRNLNGWVNNEIFQNGRREYMLTEEGNYLGELADKHEFLKVHDFTDETYAVAAEYHQQAIEAAYMGPIGIPKQFFLIREGLSGVTPRYVVGDWFHYFGYLNVEEGWGE